MEKETEPEVEKEISNEEVIAKLGLIDEIVREVGKVRGIDLPPVCIKLLFLSYWLYVVNTYDIKYHNDSLGRDIRLNSGCIILCQKGTGKSLSLGIFKQIFACVETERQRRYDTAKEFKIGRWERSMIPLNSDQKKEIETFYATTGTEPVRVFKDTTTSKNLCDAYSQAKRAGVNNILFNIDEAGDRIFKDAYSKNPSISAKEFVSSINELFDGYCGMGQSKTSKNEGVSSQYDVGANFIFVSTAEFLKDYHVQQRYQSSFEGGFARRLLFVNCPPIDELKTGRKFYKPDLAYFAQKAKETIDAMGKTYSISFDDELKKLLEQEGSGSNISIGSEFLLLIFCTALAAWTGKKTITKIHWNYMLNVFQEMKDLTLEVVQQDTTTYDKICVFIREQLEKNSKKKKVSLALVKDYCVRNKLCFDSKFKKWFDNLCTEFASANSSRYIIEKNQMFAWLDENFAYQKGG